MADALSDLLDDDEDDQTNPQQDSKSKAAFAQMRKDLKAAQTEAEEGRAWRAEREKSDRENAITGIFTEVGLNPKHAKLFSALNPEGDPTAETVAQFAAEYGLVTTAGEEVEAPEPRSPGFTPTVISEGQALGAKTYNAAEWLELSRSNQAEAQKVLASGRVDLTRA